MERNVPAHLPPGHTHAAAGKLVPVDRGREIVSQLLQKRYLASGSSIPYRIDEVASVLWSAVVGFERCEHCVHIRVAAVAHTVDSFSQTWDQVAT